MRTFNFISLIVMLATGFFTWSAIAAPAPARQLASQDEVHLINNLEEKDLKLVMQIMEERGYKVVDHAIFSRSDKTVSITKAHADEVDPASVEIQVFAKSEDQKLPKEVFNHKVITDSLSEALKLLPRPGDLPKLGHK